MKRKTKSTSWASYPTKWVLIEIFIEPGNYISILSFRFVVDKITKMHTAMFQNKLKYILFTILLTFVIGITSSCNKEKKCNGCYEDTPWSAKDSSSELCYPSEASCEAALGDGMCDKCDRTEKGTN